jgi:hypothetical protein
MANGLKWGTGRWNKDSENGRFLSQFTQEIPFEYLHKFVNRHWRFNVHVFAAEHPQFLIYEKESFRNASKRALDAAYRVRSLTERLSGVEPTTISP